MCQKLKAGGQLTQLLQNNRTYFFGPLCSVAETRTVTVGQTGPLVQCYDIDFKIMNRDQFSMEHGI